MVAWGPPGLRFHTKGALFRGPGEFVWALAMAADAVAAAYGLLQLVIQGTTNTVGVKVGKMSFAVVEPG